MYLQRHLLTMTVPFLVLVFIFSYLPLWGWIMAFQKYNLGRGIWASPFVGLDNFVTLFRDDQFYNVLRNTLAMGLLGLVSGFVGAIGLALLLNEVRLVFFKRTIQTITYIPHFVSWVVIANIMITFLSPDDGIVNVMLVKLGLIKEHIYFLSKESWFWYIHTFAGLWKELGWSTIIYLAVIAGINPEFYEAADVDGANRFQKMWHISIPGLMPTAMLLLLMSVGWIIQSGFESQFLLGNPLVINRSEVLDLYALRYSTQLGDFSYGVAISMFKSVVSVILVLSANYLAKLTNQSRLF
ncbi:ABC transporter permease [Paenibacillus sp.]|uniref:ABC transporter permease n=1 Tax=Paenibacillus sp. TaxID=58172 RepID=UPI002D31485C|nr:ABC transporter permease subunit [Paenibacillus sp.]HZG58669.1 ABC transporter permease subunit [Paenibacillus sp.]